MVRISGRERVCLTLAQRKPHSLRAPSAALTY